MLLRRKLHIPINIPPAATAFCWIWKEKSFFATYIWNRKCWNDCMSNLISLMMHLNCKEL